MTVPANFTAALSETEASIGRWLEIEGLPYAYGSFLANASFFSGRAAALQFLGIQPYLISTPPPHNLDQTIDTLTGGALTVGSTDFEIVDADNTLVQWAGIGYKTHQLFLSADITAAATTIPFNGSNTGYANGQYIYIGTETIKVGTVGASSFTGCTRAQFRSTAQAFGAGYPIGERPYTFANRRCWYYQVAKSGQGRQTLTALDTDKALRLAGTATSFKIKDGDWATFVFTVDSIDRELNRNCFRVLRSFTVKGVTIQDKDGKNGTCQVQGWPGFTSGYNVVYNVPTGLFTNGELLLLRIDDEIFYGIYTAAMSSIALRARAQFGTVPTDHKDGALVTEIIPVIAGTGAGADTSSQIPMELCSKFTSAPTTAVPVAADHPLALILQVLLSTGLGSNTPGGGARNYDVLPANWGMGANYTRVDVAGIEVLMQEEPSIRFGGLIEAPINFCDFIRNLLTIAGYYYIVQLGDLFTIRRLRQQNPDEITSTIDDSNRIRKYYTNWDANWSGAVREVVFQYAWDRVDGKYKRTSVFELAEGDVYSKGLARGLTFESKFLYPGGTGIPGEPHFAAFDVEQWLLTRKDFYRVRYGRPPPIIKERVTYNLINLEVGDLVIVTHSNLPSTVSGARGIAQEIGEIIGKSIEDDARTILFTIILTGYSLGAYRFIAPALESQSIDQSNPSAVVVTYKANSFTEAIGPHGSTQNDGVVEATDGTPVETFGGGMPIQVWTPDFAAHIDVNCDGFNSTAKTLTFDNTLALDLSAGCIITLGVFNDVSGVGNIGGMDNVDETTLYAFGAKSNNALGSGNADGHKLFPL